VFCSHSNTPACDTLCMFAVYRLFKPLAFSFSLITRVLVLGRMLSLVTVAGSRRQRAIVARIEVFALLIAVASSLVSCGLMWRSTHLTFQAAEAFEASAAATSNSSRGISLASAQAIALSSSRMNEANNSFLLAFYSLYATACTAITAVVFHTLRSMLHSIESQKLLLREADMSADASKQLVLINEVASQKSQRVRILMQKVVLNCSVVVIAALFSLWIDSFSVVGGLQGPNPPPPCPSDASMCDACERGAVALAEQHHLSD
jgi:hypothetical protein